MKLFLYIFISLPLVAFSCKNTRQTSDMKKNELSAQESEGWHKVSNADGRYTLFFQKKEDLQNPSTKNDFYIEDANGSKIFESSIEGGYVKWYDATKVEFFSPPGMMPSAMDKEDFIMIYDIEKGETFKKSSLKR